MESILYSINFCYKATRHMAYNKQVLLKDLRQSILNSSYYYIGKINTKLEHKPKQSRAEEVCGLLKNKKDSSIWILLMNKMQFILTAINSNMKIEPQAFKLYTRVVMDLIVRSLKWYRIIPTLHTGEWHGGGGGGGGGVGLLARD